MDWNRYGCIVFWDYAGISLGFGIEVLNKIFNVQRHNKDSTIERLFNTADPYRTRERIEKLSKEHRFDNICNYSSLCV